MMMTYLLVASVRMSTTQTMAYIIKMNCYLYMPAWHCCTEMRKQICLSTSYFLRNHLTRCRNIKGMCMRSKVNRNKRVSCCLNTASINVIRMACITYSCRYQWVDFKITDFLRFLSNSNYQLNLIEVVSDQISVSGVLATNNSNMWIFKMKLGFCTFNARFMHQHSQVISNSDVPSHYPSVTC